MSSSSTSNAWRPRLVRACRPGPPGRDPSDLVLGRLRALHEPGEGIAIECHHLERGLRANRGKSRRIVQESDLAEIIAGSETIDHDLRPVRSPLRGLGFAFDDHVEAVRRL